RLKPARVRLDAVAGQVRARIGARQAIDTGGIAETVGPRRPHGERTDLIADAEGTGSEAARPARGARPVALEGIGVVADLYHLLEGRPVDPVDRRHRGDA